MRKCKVCHGQKTVYGMGSVREKCKECNGKGFHDDVAKVVTIDKEPNEKVFTDVMPILAKDGGKNKMKEKVDGK